MPPRKPKQPAKGKATARKGAAKKSGTPDFNPQTHILGDDGKVYERKVVSGTGASVGVNQDVKTNAHLELEAKIGTAIQQAHSEGISDPDEIRRRILAARAAHLDSQNS
jgi:hypothetical protein